VRTPRLPRADWLRGPIALASTCLLGVLPARPATSRSTHTYEEMTAALKTLPVAAHPDLATLAAIGQTRAGPQHLGGDESRTARDARRPAAGAPGRGDPGGARASPDSAASWRFTPSSISWTNYAADRRGQAAARQPRDLRDSTGQPGRCRTHVRAREGKPANEHDIDRRGQRRPRGRGRPEDLNKDGFITLMR